MTVAITDGVLGLEAVHDWDNEFQLNDLSVTPRTRLLKITGIHSLAEADDERANNVGRSGEKTYFSHERGRTIVYEGVIESRTLPGLRATATAMRAAFRSRMREKYMTVIPHEDWGETAHEYEARVIALDIDDVQDRSPQSSYVYGREFSLSVRQSDPRFYHTVPQSASSTSGVGVACQNLGLAPTPPWIDVPGPVSGDLTFARSGGKALVFEDVEVPGDDDIRLDFRTRRLYLLDDGEDQTGKIKITDSNWWDEDEDELRAATTETVTVTGGSFTVHWKHANP